MSRNDNSKKMIAYKKHIPNNIIRDLSWLSFNERVLQEAMDTNNHVYDRLKFLGIFSNNQDEFFRVRVATLKRMATLGKKANVHLEDNPEKIIQTIHQRVEDQQKLFTRTYSDIIKTLSEYGIYIKNNLQLSKEQKNFVATYFDEKVVTSVVPLMIETIPQMPLLRDTSIYLACVLRKTDHPEMKRFALIEVPTKQIGRFIELPTQNEERHIILLEEIIKYNLPYLFAAFGYDHCTGHIIKVIRDAELDIDNDINNNIISEIEKGLKNRKKGKTTRFVYDARIDKELLTYLTKRLGLSTHDIKMSGGRIHNFKDYMDFPAAVFKDLHPRKKAIMHKKLEQPKRIFDVLDKEDIMLHLPYHSFDSVIDLLREAAIDPHVKSIKITCYRLASNSKIINALINAVRNGKQVAVHIELRARFDEEANLNWKRLLEDEGVQVFVGLSNMKVHAKMCIIKKVLKHKTQLYGFVSTGNLNEKTALYYGDECLLTSNKKILTDINKVFEHLEQPQLKAQILNQCKTVITSPINMRNHFIKLIDNEIKNAKRHRTAGITIKLNSLVDEDLIGKLYEAAHFGVEVNLILRGICCAITKNRWFRHPINALSIVDEYLEHARIFVFQNQDNPLVYISSADWMVRNLDHRVETAIPIFDTAIKTEIIDILNIQLKENVKGRILDNKQKNKYIQKHEFEPTVRSQLATYEYLYKKNASYK